MVEAEFKRVLDEVEFDYGTHTVTVNIWVEKTDNGFEDSFVSNYNFRSGERYLRTVSVTASQNHENKNDTSTVSKTTKCEIRTETKEPNFSVPDDPKLRLMKRLLARVSDEHTVDSLKQDKRDRLKKEWNKRYKSKGPTVELSTQIESTARPVLEKLDEYYFVLDTEYESSVDDTIERLEAEVSVADIDSDSFN